MSDLKKCDLLPDWREVAGESCLERRREDVD